MTIKKIVARLVLDYFRYFAQLELKKNPSATIIGITGSVGKTSTRLALVQILKSHGKVKHTVHANSQSGISLDILGLHPTNYSFFDWLRLIILAPIRVLTNHEHFNYYVVEMGIDSPDEPGNMSYLLKIVRPDIGVVLNASLAHAESFDYLVKDQNPERRTKKLISLIAKEKMQLAKGVSQTGVAIINIDQPELVRQQGEIIARQITFGKSVKADLRILPDFGFKYQGITHKLILKDLYSDSYSYTFAAAIASAAAIGIPPTISIPSLSGYRAPAGRMRLLSGLSDSLILDSSYNASPSSMLESLKLLKQYSGHHRKIAVIGDMRELGISSKTVHKDLADWLTLYSDEAILFGSLTREFTLPVLQSKKFKVHHFDRMSDLIAYLRSAIKPKSYILVKGSQNKLYLERAVAGVLRYDKDLSQLCRRGPYWDELRSKNP